MTPNPPTPEPPAPVRPAPVPRPTLLPGLRRIWRGSHRLQLGTDPDRAVVLDLPDPAVARLLDLLDGAHSERAVIAAAARYGIEQADARGLLDALTEAGLMIGAQALLPGNLAPGSRQRLIAEAAALALRGTQQPATPAQILRRRSAARVVVTGHGPLAAPVALALAQAGVGHVAPRIVPAPPVRVPVEPPERGAPAAGAARMPAAPPHRPEPVPGSGWEPASSEELAAQIARIAPGTRTWSPRRRETSLVVQVGAAGPANLAAAGYARHRLAHLAVGVRDGAAVIGPFVPPGGGPCLNCLDLHRRDRDPDWPEVAAQLARPQGEPCGVATVLCAAGLATGEALHWIDGGTPATLGASLEITAPGPPRRRSWPPHPHCHCFERYLRARPRTASS